MQSSINLAPPPVRVQHCSSDKHHASVAADPKYAVLASLESWTAANDRKDDERTVEGPDVTAKVPQNSGAATSTQLAESFGKETALAKPISSTVASAVSIGAGATPVAVGAWPIAGTVCKKAAPTAHSLAAGTRKGRIKVGTAVAMAAKEENVRGDTGEGSACSPVPGTPRREPEAVTYPRNESRGINAARASPSRRSSPFIGKTNAADEAADSDTSSSPHESGRAEKIGWRSSLDDSTCDEPPFSPPCLEASPGRRRRRGAMTTDPVKSSIPGVMCPTKTNRSGDFDEEEELAKGSKDIELQEVAEVATSNAATPLSSRNDGGRHSRRDSCNGGNTLIGGGSDSEGSCHEDESCSILASSSGCTPTKAPVTTPPSASTRRRAKGRELAAGELLDAHRTDTVVVAGHGKRSNPTADTTGDPSKGRQRPTESTGIDEGRENDIPEALYRPPMVPSLSSSAVQPQLTTQQKQRKRSRQQRELEMLADSPEFQAFSSSSAGPSVTPGQRTRSGRGGGGSSSSPKRAMHVRTMHTWGTSNRKRTAVNSDDDSNDDTQSSSPIFSGPKRVNRYDEHVRTVTDYRRQRNNIPRRPLRSSGSLPPPPCSGKKQVSRKSSLSSSPSSSGSPGGEERPQSKKRQREEGECDGLPSIAIDSKCLSGENEGRRRGPYGGSDDGLGGGRVFPATLYRGLPPLDPDADDTITRGGEGVAYVLERGSHKSNQTSPSSSSPAARSSGIVGTTPDGSARDDDDSFAEDMGVAATATAVEQGERGLRSDLLNEHDRR